jgi:hypothetical protein
MGDVKSEEVWGDIEGYKGKYRVSNKGRVKSLRRKGHLTERLLLLACASGRYLQVALYSGRIRKHFLIHRLVAKTFLDNLLQKEEVNHKNGIKTDNRVENLEWCTHSENMDHAVNILDKKMGPKGGTRGSLNGNLKLTDRDIIEVRRLLKETNFSQEEIGNIFQVNRVIISYIKLRKTWRHV